MVCWALSPGLPSQAQTVFPSHQDTDDVPLIQSAPKSSPKPAPTAEQQQAAREQRFWDALQKDDEWAFSNAVFAGADPNLRLANGNTALHEAVSLPAPRIAQVLLRQPGVDLDARNKAGETPLMLAVLRGQVALAQSLIAAKAAINHPGWTPLHYAAAATYEQAPAMISLLLDNYAYIDAESPNGTTPLMMAARYGRPDSVKLLVELGADVNLINAKGLSALDFAKAGAKPDSIRLLDQVALDNAALPKGTW
ncbi:ankyrin repeat domain-containing protein [Comamonadaceae bacterium M7527]|nr:ankyrin repeat domain-containing protein [Comamonadaceae bacterium M7527]